MISRRTFAASTLALAGAAACGPLRSLAQQFGPKRGTLVLNAPTRLPFVLSGNHVYIRASVGGAPYAFIFDTGGAAIVTTAVAKAMGFAVVGQAQVGGAGSATQTADLVRVPGARIGDATYTGGTFLAIDPPRGVASPIPGLTFGGIFGRELFLQLVTTIDYAAATLTFTPPALFRPDPSAAVLPMRLRNGALPNVTASVDGASGAFDVDAGSAAGITLTAPFARAAGLPRAGAPTIDVILGYGAGGPVEATALRAESFTVGAITFPDPMVAIARPTGVFAEADLAGNIGGEVLRRFTVTLDAPGGKLYLVPNARLRDPLAFNRAGVFARADAAGDTVVLVVPNGPGAEAGVRAGDVLVAVDGAPKTHDQIGAAWLRPAGTRVAVTLRRGGRTVDATIVLRDLI